LYTETNFAATVINNVAIMKAEEVHTQAADIWQDPHLINVELFSAMIVFNN